jgi:hypothetical protein
MFRSMNLATSGTLHGKRRAHGRHRAHLDTVFPQGTALQTREEANRLFGPGISDNAAGVTALLAVATALKRTRSACHQHCFHRQRGRKRGEGNLRGMRHLFPRRLGAISFTPCGDRWRGIY